jgi:hypothetical protein
VALTYEEAKAILASFTAGIQNDDEDWQPSHKATLYAAAERDRVEAIRFAEAFATVWRADVEKPGFALPPLDLVVMVEYLIGEPVWTKRYYSGSV